MTLHNICSLVYLTVSSTSCTPLSGYIRVVVVVLSLVDCLQHAHLAHLRTMVFFANYQMHLLVLWSVIHILFCHLWSH